MLRFLRIPVRRQQLLLLGVDLAILFVSLPVAVMVRRAGTPVDLPAISPTSLPRILLEFFRYYTGATTITMAVFVAMFFVFDLYATERSTRSPRDFLYILFVCALAVLAIPTLYYFAPHWKVGRGLLILQGLFVAIGAFAWRLVYTRVHRRLARPRRVLCIGAGRAARTLLEEIHENYQSEIEIVGLLDDDPVKAGFELNGYRVIGGTRDVDRLCRENRVETIVFAISREGNPVDAELMRDILGLKTAGIEVYQMPTFFKMVTGRVPVEIIEDSWLIFNQGFARAESGPAGRVRRLLDLAIAVLCLLILSPLVVLIALAIKLTSRGPVLYRQERLGLNRRPYSMLKFRSMVTDAERGRGPTWSAGKADKRVTWIGRVLRRTRMDEIPNFLNVLRGEMSIVGPRPERAHFVALLEQRIPYYGLRFAVKPGMTGWAQVNFSYGASVEDARRKLQYEMFYIQERTLFLDFVILLKTAQTILLRPGS
jgi:exopolysaccharide biosynthesis polyprenyl glycosylphosphotransferase